MTSRGDRSSPPSPALRGATTYIGALPPSPLADRNILQIIPELESGGTERTTLDIAAALAEAGARALVAGEGGQLVSELQAKGGIWLPFPARAKNPLAMMINVRRLANLVRRERVDLVHVRSRACAWVAYGATRLGRRRPFVTTFNGSYADTALFKLRYNSVMARGDAVIVNSRFAAEAVKALYPAAADRLVVIGSGIDLRSFSPAAVAPARVQVLRQAWNVSADERVVLLAARLAPWNGQRVLIEAARLVRQAGGGDVRIILAGESAGRRNYAKELDVQIEASGLKGIVRRIGHCADMPAALLAASVVVVPSLRPESFPRVAVEAQAMGTPVIGSDIGAMSEAILAPPNVTPAARTGWLVPPDDAAALAAALTDALEVGASARDALARRARAHVESAFSAELTNRDTLALYAHLVAQGVPRS
jgi:glycosyltransferase involved in cell wall biosynthesis